MSIAHMHAQMTTFAFFSTLLGAKLFGKQLRSNDVVVSVLISVLGVVFRAWFVVQILQSLEFRFARMVCNRNEKLRGNEPHAIVYDLCSNCGELLLIAMLQ